MTATPIDESHRNISIVMDAAKSVTAHFKPDVTLTVARQGVGDVNPDVGVHTFIRDHVASVSASPANGFDHWEGDLEEDDNPNNPMQVVELTQSKSLTAVFKPMYTLTVAREGDGGTVSPGVGPHEYRSGESASLSAFGNDEWLFTGWSGDVSGTLPLKTLVMDGNKSATAHFIQAIKITVNKVGQGSVSPGTGVYPKGGTRTFTATPATGWRWDHWEGVPSGQEGDASLELPMDQSRTITAHFIERAKLTVVKELIGNLPADGGAVSPGEGVHEYDKGEVVNLSATADSGWRFKQWSGGASGTNASTTVTMSGDKTVTATFIQRHTITTTAITRGIITPETGTWDHGQSVSFVWEKESNFCFCQFSHWAGLPASFSTTEWGAGTSTQTTVNFTVNDSYHLDAYDENTFVTLTTHVDADGCNDCAVDPAEPSFYLRDTPATVTATPGAGWGFVRWEGDVPAGMEEDNPLTLTMDENKDVTAVFVPSAYTLTIDVNPDVGDVTTPPAGEYSYSAGENYEVAAPTQVGNYVFDKWEIYYSKPGWTRHVEGNPGQFEMADSNAVLKALYTRKTCGELLEGEGTSVTVDFPNWDYLKDACETAAKAAPMISDISITANGSASLSTGTVCCEPASTSELPSPSYSMSGTANAGISVTLNVPGWSWYVDSGFQQPIQFYTVFEVNLGPSVTVSPSGSIVLEGGTADCGGNCGIIVSLTGEVGLAVGFGGTVNALVEVFEEGHWYSIDGGVQFELSASASSNVGVTGKLNITTEEIGQGCGSGGASVTGVSVGYGDVVGTGKAIATIAGYGVSIQHSWTLVEGYSYP